MYGERQKWIYRFVARRVSRDEESLAYAAGCEKSLAYAAGCKKSLANAAGLSIGGQGQAYIDSKGCLAAGHRACS